MCLQLRFVYNILIYSNLKRFEISRNIVLKVRVRPGTQKKCETKIGIAVSNVFFHFSIKIFVSLKKKDYICPQISIFKLNFNVQISYYTSRPHDGCYGSSRRKADGNY